ncbi:MAG: hypothetical protein KatS3mg082_1486 [Nitrospiraceae bacterium]|nr:MAG: hypothetical protein KatS3mg082_1486 [Nitrospiraceae bacterium]
MSPAGSRNTSTRSSARSPGTRPSANYVEELLRITALVHDIGHGPFCHFFDDNFLKAFHLTHEKLGQIIIRDHLGPIIRKIPAQSVRPVRQRRGAEPRPDRPT